MVSSYLLWAACKEELYHACMRHTYTTRKRCVGHISMSACCVVEKHAFTYTKKQSLPLSPIAQTITCRYICTCIEICMYYTFTCNACNKNGATYMAVYTRSLRVTNQTDHRYSLERLTLQFLIVLRVQLWSSWNQNRSNWNRNRSNWNQSPLV